MSEQKEQPTTVYISFSAEISLYTTESLIALLAQQVTKGVKEVHLLISTPGGDVTNGMNLYNVLRGMPLKLITHNVGKVDSIGNVVFLAGNPRYACPQATFMFHGIAANTKEGFQFEETKLRETLEMVLREQEKIGAIIIKHTSLKITEVAEFFGKAATVDAALAVSRGIVDEIREVQIPPGVPVLSLVFKR